MSIQPTHASSPGRAERCLSYEVFDRQSHRIDVERLHLERNRATEAGRLYLINDENTQAIFRIEASPLQGTWETPPPDTLLAGATLSLRSTIRLRRQVADAEPAQLTANLAALGGPEALPLQRIDDQTYRLEADLAAGEHNGRKKLLVHLAQGDEETKLVHSVVVLPSED